MLGNNIINYRPYKRYIYFIGILVISAVFMVTFLFWGLRKQVEVELDILSVLFLVSICLFVSFVYMYKDYKLNFVFTDDGISVFKGKKDRFIPWEEISYAYSTRSFKGCVFLLLSSESVSEKQSKKITNRAVNKSSFLLDDKIVIPVLHQKQVNEQIKLLVETKVGSIIDRREFYW